MLSTIENTETSQLYKPGQLVRLASGEEARVVKTSYTKDVKARVNGAYAELAGASVLPSWAAEDLDYDACVRAHRGTSMSPEHRGYLHFNDYDNDLKRVRDACDDDGFERFRAGYKEKYKDYLNSLSNVTSSFVTGPSGRHTRREEKRSKWADAKAQALHDYVEKWLRPKSTAIFADDPEAISKLETKLKQAQEKHERMKGVNRAYKAFKKRGEAALEGSSLSEADQDLVRTFEEKDGWCPFAAFTLSNSNARMRNMKKRLQALKAAPKESLCLESDVEGVSYVENAELVRVQLLFEGKPPVETRKLLKSKGFRWSPSQGAWQRQLTPNGKRAAREILTHLKAA